MCVIGVKGIGGINEFRDGWSILEIVCERLGIVRG